MDVMNRIARACGTRRLTVQGFVATVGLWAIRRGYLSDLLDFIRTDGVHVETLELDAPCVCGRCNDSPPDELLN